MLIEILVYITIFIADPTIGQSCSEIVPDAITQLHNGTIAIFQDTNVWLFERMNKELIGPCPISSLYEGMKGPLDAAVTIWEHPSVTEFIGASVYFGSDGNFFTYKNLRPYQVEWGDLIYLPVKGIQANIGEGKKTKIKMSTKMSAAFFGAVFDTKAVGRSNLVFNNEILGFSFELGSEFDRPDVSDLDTMFKELNVSVHPSGNITAALTLKDSKQILLFFGSQYCTIKFDPEISVADQTCTLQAIDNFFECESVNENRCEKSSVKLEKTSFVLSNRSDDQVIPIAVTSDKTAKDIKVVKKDGRVGSDEQKSSVSSIAANLAFDLILFVVILFI